MLFGIVVILCIPLIAMQFTNEVQWKSLDFLIALVLLLGLAITIEFVLQKTKGLKTKRAWVALAVFIFLLIWAELAVGLFGSPLAGS